MSKLERKLKMGCTQVSASDLINSSWTILLPLHHGTPINHTSLSIPSSEYVYQRPYTPEKPSNDILHIETYKTQRSYLLHHYSFWTQSSSTPPEGHTAHWLAQPVTWTQNQWSKKPLPQSIICKMNTGPPSLAITLKDFDSIWKKLLLQLT
jgi:hypothetical protein